MVRIRKHSRQPSEEKEGAINWKTHDTSYNRESLQVFLD